MSSTLLLDESCEIKWVELSDASICEVAFKDLGNNWLEIRTFVDAVVELHGRTCYGYDSDYTIKSCLTAKNSII